MPESPAAYVLLALALLALGAASLWAHVRFWVGRLTLPLAYAVEEVLRTEDGSRIELRRVPRAADPPGRGTGAEALPPVLLVHGLGANHRNQDIHPDYSLARHLAALGRDVWLLTLRSGLALGRAERRRVRFAAMARYDLPLAVETIAERTGRRCVDYVGFSMGGMLLYAAIGRGVPEERIRRAVIVGSPGRIAPPSRLVRLLPHALTPGIPFRFFARLIAFASEWLTTPFHHVVANPRNVPPGITRLTLVNVVEDVPASLNGDFLVWAAGDGEIRVDGERVLDRLGRVGVPALFVAGSADKIAPAPAVRCAFEAWGHDRPETPKRFMVLGRDFGAREDYGHGDLAMGARVGVELFEPIARFLGPDAQAETPGPEIGPDAREEIQAREPLPDQGTSTQP